MANSRWASVPRPHNTATTDQKQGSLKVRLKASCLSSAPACPQGTVGRRSAIRICGAGGGPGSLLLVLEKNMELKYVEKFIVLQLVSTNVQTTLQKYSMGAALLVIPESQ